VALVSRVSGPKMEPGLLRRAFSAWIAGLPPRSPAPAGARVAPPSPRGTMYGGRNLAQAPPYLGQMRAQAVASSAGGIWPGRRFPGRAAARMSRVLIVEDQPAMEVVRPLRGPRHPF
jgi:hypothetical protein